MEMKFLICKHCGNIVGVVRESGVPVVCCGEEMELLVPNTTEAAHEKHIPVTARSGSLLVVTVGIVEHPMTPDHHIEWIALQTKHGNQRKALYPGQPPRAAFCIADGDEVEAVYSYCSLHGLWKA